MNRIRLDSNIINDNGKRLIEELLLKKQMESENYPNEQETGVKYIMDYRHKNIKYFDGHRFRIIPYMKYVSLIVDYIISGKSTNNDSIKYLISEQTDHEIALIYAYRGYKKFRGQINDNKAVEDLSIT